MGLDYQSFHLVLSKPAWLQCHASVNREPPGDTQSCKPSWPQSSTTIYLNGGNLLDPFPSFSCKFTGLMLACLPALLPEPSIRGMKNAGSNPNHEANQRKQ
ncbi:hypothetical protein D5086_018911 [Populus alba]|uniref:Uncharacterized protein n=1 Tax=Populus alba TaxID=43335 RepID=A0ACC4BSN4_POPAL